MGYHLVSSRPPAEPGLELVDPEFTSKRPGHRSPSTPSADPLLSLFSALSQGPTSIEIPDAPFRFPHIPAPWGGMEKAALRAASAGNQPRGSTLEPARCRGPAVAQPSRGIRPWGGRGAARRPRNLRRGGRFARPPSRILSLFFFFLVGGRKTTSRWSVCTDEKWKGDTPSASPPSGEAGGGRRRASPGAQGERAAAPALTRPADRVGPRVAQ